MKGLQYGIYLNSAGQGDFITQVHDLHAMSSSCWYYLLPLIKPYFFEPCSSHLFDGVA